MTESENPQLSTPQAALSLNEKADKCFKSVINKNTMPSINSLFLNVWRDEVLPAIYALFGGKFIMMKAYLDQAQVELKPFVQHLSFSTQECSDAGKSFVNSNAKDVIGAVVYIVQENADVIKDSLPFAYLKSACSIVTNSGAHSYIAQSYKIYEKFMTSKETFMDPIKKKYDGYHTLGEAALNTLDEFASGIKTLTNSTEKIIAFENIRSVCEAVMDVSSSNDGAISHVANAAADIATAVSKFVQALSPSNFAIGGAADLPAPAPAGECAKGVDANGHCAL